MDDRHSRVIARVLLGICAAATLGSCTRAAQTMLVETKSISEGSFRGIEIGASKETTLRAIRNLDVFSVRPIPMDQFNITHENASELSRIASSDGIRLTNYRGLAIDLFLSDGRVSEIRRSIPAKDNSWFHEGESTADVIRQLSGVLDSDRSFSVFPIVRLEGDGWTRLKTASSSQLQALMRHDAWMFEMSRDKPSGAFVELRFANDQLASIDYKRPRIPLE